MGTSNINVTSDRGQFMVVLLAALEDLSEQRIPTKRDVESHIEKCRYPILSSELEESYACKAEPRRNTLIAWARLDAIKRALMEPMRKRDAWEIGEKGRERLHKMQQALKDGKLDINRFTLWSPKFIRRMTRD